MTLDKMQDKQQIFDKFMDEFVKLPIDVKNKEIIEKQKKIMAHLIKYSELNNIPYTFLKSKEITDITDDNGTNEDYLEAMMVYTENIEELIGNILLNK